MRLVSQCLNLQTSIYLEFINIVEHLMSVFMDDFKTEWWVEFVDILHSLGKLILPYHEHFPNELIMFWNLVKLTEVEEQMIDIVMEQMPITNLLTEFLSSDTYNHFVVGVRLIGNILASSNSEYCQNFYKNNLLENLVIGWQKYSLPEVDKECSWILGNVIASNNLIMTKAVINNQYFCSKFQEIL